MMENWLLGRHGRLREVFVATGGSTVVSNSPLSRGGHIVQGVPHSQNRGGEAKRGKTKLFWSPGTIWPPCDKGEWNCCWAMLADNSVK